ncbi:hypothetical protein KTR66_04575 [Roseococcus sp. SDR]|uniref:hypothetical protein n=1 Tax=Roseococcus sp. SDR TaxID=2835532 RepID=UPI001BD14513|nr:hypothetical protein [Roseococcus sp. SDR]MBS7789254.1 hypothetical protein [Roseococcus sp. SDR]MBV1844568.1 hypothetical protein [Roseococcus sp. SDR]
MPLEVALVGALIGMIAFAVFVVRQTISREPERPPVEEPPPRRNPPAAPAIAPRPLTAIEAAQVGLRGQAAPSPESEFTKLERLLLDPNTNWAEVEAEAAKQKRATSDFFDLRREAPIRIRYIAADGELTERDVDVRSFKVEEGPDGPPVAFRGRCHVREANRSFLIRRVQHAFDLTDGTEILDVEAWLRAQPSRRRPRDLDL